MVLGDTALPPGPISGGSMVTGSLVPAVFAAADAAIASLLAGRVAAKDAPSEGVPFGDLLRPVGVGMVNGRGSAKGSRRIPSGHTSSR